MEPEEIPGKFHEELKWGSYYFLTSLILGFVIAFFQVFVFDNSTLINSISIFLNLILLVYFSLKCIKEKKNLNDVPFLSNFFILFKIFGIYLLYMTLLTSANNLYIMPKKEIEILEDNSEEKKSNMLNDLILMVKRKIKN